MGFDWLDFVNAPVFVLALPGPTVLRTNEALRRVLGGALPEAAAPLASLIGPLGAEAVTQFIRTMPADGSRNTLRATCATAHGAVDLILHLKKLPDAEQLWAVTVDERTLFFNSVSSGNAEETFRGIIQGLPIGIEIFDSAQRGVFYNRFSDALYLYDSYYDLEMSEWFEHAFPEPEARQAARQRWDEAIAALDRDPSQPQVMEWTVMCRDGVSRILHNEMSKIGSHYTFIYWDITESRALEATLRRLASTDMLTGTSSRRYFFEQAEAILAAPRTASLCLLMLDIDYFKSVNDSFGHRAGDQALVAVARLCRAALSGTDILARFGGEEFVVLLPGRMLQEARSVAERILQSVSERPIPTVAGGLYVTISMGLASLDPAEADIDLLIERADAALYAAKRAGRNRIVTSADEMTPPVR